MEIDQHHKVCDTIKILISLFAADVTAGLAGEEGPRTDKVFFFAFDQIEGRKELFEEDADWFKFFAQMSELYNTLPNVFVLFTMTLRLRNRVSSAHGDAVPGPHPPRQGFALAGIEDDEILSLYRQRVRAG